MIENISGPKASVTSKSVTHGQSIIINNDDVESYYARAHKKMSWILLGFLLASSYGFLYLVANHQNMYFVQCAQCKTVFFGGFYFYFLSVLVMLMVYLKNLRTELFDSKDDIFLLSSFKAILSVFVSQLVFIVGFFAAESYYCSINLGNILIDQLIFQVLQFSAIFFLNFLYFIKIYKEVEPVINKLTNEGQKQTIELFNASFALNETKSEVAFGVDRNQNDFLKKLKMGTNNTSQFTTSCGDNTKLGSVMSLESMLCKSKFPSKTRTPKKRLGFERDVEC